MAQFITRAAVNNAILDPLQGFDIDVYVQDQATGAQLLVGNFTSFQFTVRNATEPYMEFNQRIARLLDGDYQFGWAMERGCLDVRFIQQTFGIDTLSREMRLDRSPRFQITVEMNAPALDKNPFSGTGTIQTNLNGSSKAIADAAANRKAKGRYRLIYAKTDAFTFGSMGGRSVVANRWEGLCEGIVYADDTSGWAGTDLGGVSASQIAAANNNIFTSGDNSGVSSKPNWFVNGAATFAA